MLGAGKIKIIKKQLLSSWLSQNNVEGSYLNPMSNTKEHTDMEAQETKGSGLRYWRSLYVFNFVWLTVFETVQSYFLKKS